MQEKEIALKGNEKKLKTEFEVPQDKKMNCLQSV